MNCNYQLAGRTQTTGWNPSFEPNAKNSYGMTPAEVALQAGNLSEFKEITSHPDFLPEEMGRVGLFLDICRRESEENYNALLKFIRANFVFIESKKAFVRLS